MYEDQDLWPIKCPSCGEEFFKQVGWLKTHTAIRCPGEGCATTIHTSAEEFGLALAEAKKGRFDPFRGMLRLNRPS
jgi:hypothetical protein